MVAKLDTSITDAQTRRFLADSEERSTLWCEKVAGFHLLKTKRGGSWRYRYQDATGKRRVATVGKYPAMKPQQAAQRALEWRNDDVDVLAEKEKRRHDAIEAKRIAAHRTLGRYLETPYARHQERKRSGHETLGLIRSNFRDWLDRDMSSLSKQDVEEWQQQREAKGRAHSTLRRAYGALRTLLNHAVEHEALKENPLSRVRLAQPHHTERTKELSEDRAKVRRLLTDAEVHGLQEGLNAFSDELRRQRRNSRKHGKPHLPDLDKVAFPHWFVPFCWTAFYTGLRPGDLYHLTWSELSIQFGRLVKTPAKTQHHADPARITMDLPKELVEVLTAWWEQQGRPNTGLVFPSPVTEKAMDKKAHGKPWQRVKALGALPPDLTFYALRHHFISTLVAAGVPLLTVAKLAGHKGVGMIEAHYGHLCPDSARGALEVFAAKAAKARAQA